MKAKDKAKLQQSSLETLIKQRAELKLELTKVNHERSINKQPNLKLGKTIRYQIALINTIITSLSGK